MKKTYFTIGHIPAVLWGEPTGRLMLAVHGNLSHKEDAVIEVLAAVATAKGYQVLSFDLPEHGARKAESTLCKPQACVGELQQVLQYAKTLATEISLFACSMGAYFSLLAYANEAMQQALFLSPVVDMARIIHNMMLWFNVSEAHLKAEQQIPTPAGQTLYWDYYTYVQQHPITAWPTPTWVLYGGQDTISERSCVQQFAKQYTAHLTILEDAEHFFHTEAQLQQYTQWLSSVLR